MSQSPINIGGFPLPSDAPLFLGVLAAHVAGGLWCVITGAIAMLSKNQPGRHPRHGSFYFWGLVVVFITMGILSAAFQSSFARCGTTRCFRANDNRTRRSTSPRALERLEDADSRPRVAETVNPSGPSVFTKRLYERRGPFVRLSRPVRIV